MTQQLDELHLGAWRGFITTHSRLITVIDKQLEAAGCVPLNWYDVLIELKEAPQQRLRMAELANKVVLSRSGLTRLIDKMETAGLLTRETTPEDGRGAYAVLTDVGYNALRKAWPVYAQAIQEVFASYLTENEAKLLTTVFERMLHGQSEHS